MPYEEIGIYLLVALIVFPAVFAVLDPDILKRRRLRLFGLPHEIRETTQFGVKKVMSLTQQHIDRFQDYEKSWQNQMLSTDPADRQRAEAAIKSLYKSSYLAEPLIIWTKSPLANHLAKVITDMLHLLLDHADDCHIHCRKDLIDYASAIDLNIGWEPKISEVFLSAWNSVEPHIRSSIAEHGYLNAGDPAADIIGRSDDIQPSKLLGREFIFSHWDRGWDNVCDLIKSKLHDHMPYSIIFSSMGDNSDAWFTSSLIDSTHSANPAYDLYRRWDESRFPFYKLLVHEGYIDKSHPVYALTNLCEAAGWILPYKNICFVSERPSQICMNAQNRLHNETGPALAFADGFSLYSWNGMEVPQGWIEEKPNGLDVLKFDNVERRRVAVEVLGWQHILRDCMIELIDRDGDPQIGELIKVDAPDFRDQYFLRVTCGTGREFALPVPPDMKTALQANAWTWGLEPHEYKPEIRT